MSVLVCDEVGFVKELNISKSDSIPCVRTWRSSVGGVVACAAPEGSTKEAYVVCAKNPVARTAKPIPKTIVTTLKVTSESKKPSSLVKLTPDPLSFVARDLLNFDTCPLPNGVLFLPNNGSSRLVLCEATGDCKVVGGLQDSESPEVLSSFSLRVWNAKQLLRKAKQGADDVEDVIETISEQHGKLACGGRGNNLKLWDLETQQMQWSAGGVSNDYLNLPVPIFITSIAYVYPEAENIIAVSNGMELIRLYDIRSPGRRPFLTHELANQETRITGMKRHPHKAHTLLFGDGAGNVYQVDLKMSKNTPNPEIARLHISGRLHPNCLGSIRSFQVHPKVPFIASGGLSRWLFLHDLRTMNLISKVYVKQQITCIHMSSEPALLDKFDTDQKGMYTDNVWDQVPAVDEDAEINVRTDDGAPAEEDKLEDLIPSDFEQEFDDDDDDDEAPARGRKRRKKPVKGKKNTKKKRTY